MKKIIYIILLIAIIFTTIVYSAFSTKLQIDGDLVVRSDNDIRITNLSIKESTGGAYETYNSKYTKNTTSMFVTLPSNSSITYEVEVTNSSDYNYTLSSLNELTNLNSNLTYTTDTEQYDIYDSNSIRKVLIAISNNSNEEISDSLVLEFKFDKAYSMFLSGKEFNAKIKSLAGNLDSTYNTTDSNIKNIVRSTTLDTSATEENIISTTNSTVPIYAWYDDETIYYYTKYERPLMNYDASYMFSYLKVIENLDLNTIDTSNTTSMQGLFLYCNASVLNLNNFDTSNVTNMQGMFYYSKAEVLDVSKFNTSKVTNMLGMFDNCYAVTIIGLTNFNTSSVDDIRAMFRNSYVNELDLTSFDTSKITNMLEMFHGCKATIIDLSSFDTSNLTFAGWMFYNSEVVTIYVSEKFDLSNLSSSASDGIFFNAYNIVGGNGTKYDNKYTDKTYARIDTEENPGYFTLKEK